MAQQKKSLRVKKVSPKSKPAKKMSPKKSTKGEGVKTREVVDAHSGAEITRRLFQERDAAFPIDFKQTKSSHPFRRLTADEVFCGCNLEKSRVKSFSASEPNYDIVSQERAVRAITLGLGIQKPGYNIYVAGVQGTGKTSVIRRFLQKNAEHQATPGDWIYVYNFKNVESPRAIELHTGHAKRFKKDMDEFVELLTEEIPDALQSEEYENKVNATINASNEKKSKLFGELEKCARTMNFGVKSTRMGIVTVPIIEGHPLSEKEYTELPEDTREEIENRRNELEPEVLDFARKVRAIESETRSKLEELRADIGDHVVSSAMTDLVKTYEKSPCLIEYLKEVKDHILENLMTFVRDKEDDSEDGDDDTPSPHVGRKGDPYLPYRVNVFVDNTDVKGAPIIIETNPTYYNLFGKIEKNIEYGVYTTDYKMIKAGSLARANGGYLVLNALDVFRSSHVWETLKRVLKNQKLFLEDLGEQYSLLPTSGLRPEPIALNVKIVLIGSDWIYRTLYQLDEDFNKVFKIKADFNVEMDRSEKTINDYIRFVTTRSKVENLLPFDAEAIASIIEHSGRVVEDQDKLTTRFSLIKDLTIEADFMAKERGVSKISREDVDRAVEERYQRSALVEDHVTESMERGTILVSTNSRRVGEINALVVYDLGDMTFGKPTRLTCRTYKGKPGIVNIEREAALSGKIHNKGVSILTSWIHATFGRKNAVNLSASVCFEQNYSGVDGDSATLAEIILILTTVSNIPLDQGLAVTGSVNQFGEVQPIGGVNEKVEGFFKCCQMRGLTGRQGVIIPVQNMKNLMLRQEVRKAIEEEKFHIWPVSRVEEAFEIFTGMNAGVYDEKSGKFTAKSGFELINEALHVKKGKKKKGEEGAKKTKRSAVPKRKPSPRKKRIVKKRKNVK